MVKQAQFEWWLKQQEFKVKIFKEGDRNIAKIYWVTMDRVIPIENYEVDHELVSVPWYRRLQMNVGIGVADSSFLIYGAELDSVSMGVLHNLDTGNKGLFLQKKFHVWR